MNKNELQLEIHKLSIRSRNLALWLGTVKHICSVGGIALMGHVIFVGLTNIVTAKPDSLNALALVVEKMQLGTWVGYIVALGATAGWMFERQGKKRAIKDLDGRRKQLEADDPYRAGSGLTETGETPT
ncbi:hypothetical protein N234_31535 [Ralstonia pickettii DTP0602]|nr:hypothetical protein N234_31535 [Ralstonia pickettii DTP0602]